MGIWNWDVIANKVLDKCFACVVCVNIQSIIMMMNNKYTKFW